MATADVTLPLPTLSARSDRAFRIVTTLSVAILALFAGVLSYAGLRELAVQADINPRLAWMFPIVIDGLTFVGSMGVVHAVLSRMSAWYPWLLTLLGVSISVVGNVAASPPDLMSRLVHAAPPIVLALSLEALLRVYRARAKSATRAAHEDAAAPVDAPPSPPLPDASTEPEEADEQDDNEHFSPSQAPASTHPTPVLVRDSVDAFAPPTRPQAVPVQRASDADSDKDASSTPPRTPAQSIPARVRVEEILRVEPDISGADVARRLSIDPSYARKLLRDLRDEADAAGDDSDQRVSEPQSALFA